MTDSKPETVVAEAVEAVAANICGGPGDWEECCDEARGLIREALDNGLREQVEAEYRERLIEPVLKRWEEYAAIAQSDSERGSYGEAAEELRAALLTASSIPSNESLSRGEKTNSTTTNPSNDGSGD